MDVFTTLGSVAFGWLLSGAGQWLKGRKEDRRVKKIVLYNLLETHHLFKQLDTSEDIKKISEIVFTMIPKEYQIEEVRIGITRFCQTNLQNMIEAHASEELNKLEESFTKAIDEFSKVEPLNAYRLKGKTRIMDVFNLLKLYSENVKKDFEVDNHEVAEITDKSIAEFRPDLITYSIKDLEEEIKGISLSINILTRFKVNKVIKKPQSSLTEEYKTRVIEYFKDLFPINAG